MSNKQAIMIMTAILQAAGIIFPEQEAMRIAGSVDRLTLPPQPTPDLVLCWQRSPTRDGIGNHGYCALPVGHPGNHCYLPSTWLEKIRRPA